jgi:two-component system, OmpR family, sensor kinase
VVKRLSRLRVRLTLAWAATAAISLAALALWAWQLGTDRIHERSLRALERRATDALAARDTVSSRRRQVPDSWIFDPRYADVAEPLGRIEITPPLRDLALDGRHRQSITSLSQRGREYIVLARPAGDGQVLVTLQRASEGDDRAMLALGLAAAWLGGVALSALVAWLLAGRALAPARTAVRERTEFLADAAHELRTPLSIIRASATQALARPREPDEYVRSLAEIRAAAERSATGVSELLDLARLQAGQLVPRQAPLRLDLLVEEVVAAIRHDGVTVEALASEPVVVRADLGLLRQAVENVTRNAIARARYVQLRTSAAGREAVVEVGDDGPGFEGSKLLRLSDRYVRSDEAGSAGIGLAIVRSIVEAHGGRLELANREPKGALVRLRLPLDGAG